MKIKPTGIFLLAFYIVEYNHRYSVFQKENLYPIISSIILINAERNLSSSSAVRFFGPLR